MAKRIGITGLPKSGKTVFMTAMLHNLQQLTYMVDLDPRLRPATLERGASHDVRLFPYYENLKQIIDSEDTPRGNVWPDPTEGESQIRFRIPYSWHLFDRSQTFDICDYPGEWLLDLPNMGVDFQNWSETVVNQSKGLQNLDQSMDWLGLLKCKNILDNYDHNLAMDVLQKYVKFVKHRKSEGFFDVTPGRHLFLDETAFKTDSPDPMMVFFPIPGVDQNPVKNAPSGSFLSQINKNFNDYKKHVIAPFYNKNIRPIDSLIVLVDLIDVFEDHRKIDDLKISLSKILSIFRPKKTWPIFNDLRPSFIRRVAFAVTKADHFPQYEHKRLESFLKSLLHEIRMDFENKCDDVETMVISSVKATVEIKKGNQNLIQGRTENSNGKIEGVNQQDVPSYAELKSGCGSGFVKFLPKAKSQSLDHGMPHIGLDRAFNYLIKGLI